MIHRDGKVGQKRMKAVTIALLSLIEERSGLTPAQLEAKFGLGLRSADDVETGQEWRRYTHPPSNNRRNNQALSLTRLFEIAGLARDLGYIAQDDLWQLQIIELESPVALQARVANERLAHQVFQRGKALLMAGKMPLPPAGAIGGRPRAPRSASEAAESFFAWADKIESLGGSVFEDRADVSEFDTWLMDGEPRELTSKDFELLPLWARPLDPAFPNLHALGRLRIGFSYGWVDKPWRPEYREPFGRQPEVDLESLPESDMDLEALIQALEKILQAPVGQLNVQAIAEDALIT